jgi:hypothetical protein
MRSQVIAANNIMNALLMVIASLILMGYLAAGLSIPQVFLALALMNAVVAGYIYTIIPEFLLRFVIWMLASVMYRIRLIGRENLPVSGPVVIVCNHVTFVDWMFIASAVRTPIRFVMHHAYMNLAGLRFIFRDAKVIPIAPAHENQQLMEEAFRRISCELAAGKIVCIFPEGKLTADGKLQPFKPGIERIIQQNPAPVIPMALSGLWGSTFSRFPTKKPGQPRPKRPWRRQIRLTVGAPIPAEQVSAAALEARVSALLQTTQ